VVLRAEMLRYLLVLVALLVLVHQVAVAMLLLHQGIRVEVLVESVLVAEVLEVAQMGGAGKLVQCWHWLRVHNVQLKH